MKFFNKIFKKKKERVYSDDSYIKTQFISYDNLDDCPYMVLLFTFSDDYCKYAIDITNSKLTCKFIPSSKDIELDELDEDGYNKVLSMPTNYLLIGGYMSNYRYALDNIDIGNIFVKEIIKEFYEHCDPKYFDRLIQDNVLNESLFKNNNIGELNKHIVNDHNILYTNINEILKMLPNEFTGGDLLPFYRFFDKNVDDTPYNYYDNLIDINNRVTTIDNEALNIIYNGVIKDPTIENLLKLIQPLYKREIPDDEIITGEISSVELDELFTQQYNRFNAVMDNTISYADIDEELSEDDPEYNLLQDSEEEDY